MDCGELPNKQMLFIVEGLLPYNLHYLAPNKVSGKTTRIEAAILLTLQDTSYKQRMLYKESSVIGV